MGHPIADEIAQNRQASGGSRFFQVTKKVTKKKEEQ